MLLKPHLRPVRLVSGQILIEQGHVVEHVYFVEEGVVSLVADAPNHRPGVQVAMIGMEGLIGSDALLDPGSLTLSSALVQIPGRAMRVGSHDLRCLLEECPELRRLCFAAIAALFQQVVETSASNARSTLVERCARWLLLAHKRVDSDDLFITHKALSEVLGVRRSGISVVLASLQEARLITVHRGRIAVRDRAGLERVLSEGQSVQNGSPSGGGLMKTHIAADAQTLHCSDMTYMMDGEGRAS
jgi:CRP-like cAMP-binding protein